MAKEKTTFISAHSAEKGKDYLCPECASPIRLRSGPHRQPHFYHLKPPKSCRQHEKTLEHLNTQLRLLSLISQAIMERPFPEIGRIADVAWEKRKIIFEIQYSPISLEEVKQRNADYESIGFQVIWILHEEQFNQKKLSSAEKHLRTIPCFFTDIDEKSEGIFYDQFEILKDHRRLFKGPKLPVQLNQLNVVVPKEVSAVPKSISVRYTSWTLYAKGDLLDHFEKSSAVKQMHWLEERYLAEKKKERLPLGTILLRYYEQLINFLLGI